MSSFNQTPQVLQHLALSSSAVSSHFFRNIHSHNMFDIRLWKCRCPYTECCFMGVVVTRMCCLINSILSGFADSTLFWKPAMWRGCSLMAAQISPASITFHSPISLAMAPQQIPFPATTVDLFCMCPEVNTQNQIPNLAPDIQNQGSLRWGTCVGHWSQR